MFHIRFVFLSFRVVTCSCCCRWSLSRGLQLKALVCVGVRKSKKGSSGYLVPSLIVSVHVFAFVWPQVCIHTTSSSRLHLFPCSWSLWFPESYCCPAHCLSPIRTLYLMPCTLSRWGHFLSKKRWQESTKVSLVTAIIQFTVLIFQWFSYNGLILTSKSKVIAKLGCGKENNYLSPHFV